jgi:hypothetical protein
MLFLMRGRPLILEILRSRLVHGMSIPLGKGITIPGNR